MLESLSGRLLPTLVLLLLPVLPVVRSAGHSRGCRSCVYCNDVGWNSTATTACTTETCTARTTCALSVWAISTATARMRSTVDVMLAMNTPARKSGCTCRSQQRRMTSMRISSSIAMRVTMAMRRRRRKQYVVRGLVVAVSTLIRSAPAASLVPMLHDFSLQCGSGTCLCLLVVLILSFIAMRREEKRDTPERCCEAFLHTPASCCCCVLRALLDGPYVLHVCTYVVRIGTVASKYV